jgi:hypothetical protein
VGTQVTLTGSNFTGTTSVAFGGVAAVFQQVPGGLLTVVPAGAPTGLIAVTASPGGTGSSAQPFTVTAAPPADPTPTITSFTPASGVAGTTVVVTGSNLTGATSVTVNGTAARSFTVTSPTRVSFVVGTRTTTGLVRVQAANGIATSSARFRVLPPSIRSFTPASGNSGTTVVISGTNFTGATVVTVNGRKARSFVVLSSTRIRFVVGTGTKAGVVRVQTPGGTATSTQRFTIKGKAR